MHRRSNVSEFIDNKASKLAQIRSNLRNTFLFKLENSNRFMQICSTERKATKLLIRGLILIFVYSTLKSIFLPLLCIKGKCVEPLSCAVDRWAGGS